MKNLLSLLSTFFMLLCFTLSVHANDSFNNAEHIIHYKEIVSEVNNQFDADLVFTDETYAELSRNNVDVVSFKTELIEVMQENQNLLSDTTYEEVDAGQVGIQNLKSARGVTTKIYSADHAKVAVWAGIPALGTGSILIDYSYNVKRTYSDSLSINSYTINTAVVNYSDISGLLLATWSYRYGSVTGGGNTPSGGYRLIVKATGLMTYQVGITIGAVSFPAGYHKEMTFQGEKII